MAKLDDEDFLAIVREERRQSVGFEHDDVLRSEREQALNYFKGVMNDLPSLPNRSSAVATDVADGIETVLPDLLEIFTGGDDVVTFKAKNAKDEDAAQQETDYVNQVVFQENDGFLILYSMFKDALQSKIGVVKFSWVDKPIKPEMLEGKTAVELQMLSQDGTVEDFKQSGVDPETGEPLFDLTLTNEDPGGEVKIDPVPPEDFTVSQDTVRLPDATYCAFRTRPRKQDLIDQGLPRDIIEDLPPYGSTVDQSIQLARDAAGEHQRATTIMGDHNLAQVEIIEHFVRVDGDGSGRPQLWRVLTGGGETVVIEREEVDRLPFAAITPYIITHRFYGESMADRLIQVQKIRTSLIRMMLDSGYFALNQRVEVSEAGSNEWTIADLLRNEPGMPVRVKSSGAVTPIQSGVLTFDTFKALEFVSVMGEQRTGIMRNAQGLNPETLHDTAAGMEKLMMAAQLRMRLIARVFAETGVKDMFLGVHALLRKHKHQAESKIGGKWIPVDCSQWGERSQMTISVGLGSAGRIQEMAAMQAIVGIQNEIVKLQGGAQGPIVTLPNVYNAVVRLAEKAGEKAAEEFFTDPDQAPPQQPQPPPGAAEAQAKMQSEQAKLAQQDKEHQDRMQLDVMVEHDKDQRERMKLDNEMQIAMAQNASEERIKMADLEVRRADVVNRLQLEQAKLANALQIAQITAGVQLTDQQMRAQAEADRAAVDIEIQARDHAHEDDLADFAAANQPEAAAENGD